jgi:hypothetical protein
MVLVLRYVQSLLGAFFWVASVRERIGQPTGVIVAGEAADRPPA